MKKKKLLLFDLDGTLIDSAPDLSYSVNLMLEQLGREHFDDATIHGWVGNGARTLVSRALSGSVEIDTTLDAELLERALEIFLHYYHENICVKTQLYEGVKETLHALSQAGYKMAVVTNKPYAFVSPILEKLALTEFFEMFLGGDSLEKRKPDAQPLLHVCKTLGIDVDDAVMIGDSKNDIIAAQRAGMQSIGVSYGYNYGEDITTYNPDRVVKSFKDILEHIG